jgi:predicted alpha/beta superfamily hydrolase
MEAAYGAASTVGLLGSSLGGLISLHIADLYPERYDMVISMSATLGWGSRALNNPTMIEIYEAKGRRPFAIYLDSGGGDGGMACVDADMDGIKDDNPAASDNYCENVQMRDTLAAIGHEFGVDLWHWFMPGAAHNEGAWGERMELPLSLFMGLPGPTP